MTIAIVVLQILGFLSSLHALMSVRTAQGTIAWIVSLNTVAIVAVPAYWIFGRSKLTGYVVRRQARDLLADPQVRAIATRLAPLVPDYAREPGAALAGQRLARMPYLDGNEVDLLIDGEATFASLLAGIDRAERYVLVQFYIVRDDDIGRRLRDRLVAKARAGVSVRFLFDQIGCFDLPDAYCESLTAAGVEVAVFGATGRRVSRQQINFRNHRKIVVVDGHEGWIGGLNVGDEYLGRDPQIGAWRDTHVRIAGPAVAGLQLSFVEDWSWASDQLLSQELDWPAEPRGDKVVLVAPTGPADRLETASLLAQQAIHLSQRRCWIASPYFVPDSAVVGALTLATLRGVDVRLLIPEQSDNRLVDAAAETFLESLLTTGVRVYRYHVGFLHSKHFLVDERLAGVGTANFDNRSFRLNFELTAIVVDVAFAAEVEAMFERDFAGAREVTREELAARSFWRRALSRAALLLAPVL